MNTTRKRRLLVAHHESAHAVVAILLGGKIELLTLRGETGGPYVDYERWPAVLSDKIVLLVSGGIAESRMTGNDPRGWFGDWCKIVDELDQRFGVSPIKSPLVMRSVKRAEALVNHHWRVIRRLAHALLAAGTLRGEDVHHLVQFSGVQRSCKNDILFPTEFLAPCKTILPSGSRLMSSPLAVLS